MPEASIAITAEQNLAAQPVGAFQLTPYERLFFECVLEAIVEHGIAPPPALGLPSSIGRAVDYDHVKRRMASKILGHREDNEDGRLRHYACVRMALKRSRVALAAFKVAGASDRFVWWTGKPVRGFA